MKLKPIEDLLQAIEINYKFLDILTVFNEKEKDFLKTKLSSMKDLLLKNQKLNSYQLKLLTNELLYYWNNSISCETENFWAELKNQHIEIERKEPLQFALTKKYFRNVEQGIDARNNWESLKVLEIIRKKYSNTEIQQIDCVITEDENNRYNVLKRCLEKGEIPQSKYLKFGECMAYFARCSLFDMYFKKKEVDELYYIWQTFKCTLG